MTEQADIHKASTEESGVITHPNWEAMGLQLLSEIAAREGQPILTISYPGCGTDATPSSAIPTAVVTYIDPDPANTKGLEYRSQDQFHLQTLREYMNSNPGVQFDMVYLLNSYAPNSEAVEITRDGGILVVNNWLGHADKFFSLKWRDAGITLIGVLVRDGKSIRYEVEHPGDSLTPVESEAELDNVVHQINPIELQLLEQARFIASPTVIQNIFQEVNFVMKEGEDLVAAYKRFYDKHLEDHRKRLKEEGLSGDIRISLSLKKEDGKTIELPSLPPKMAGAVLWVFEKKNNNPITE